MRTVYAQPRFIRLRAGRYPKNPLPAGSPGGVYRGRGCRGFFSGRDCGTACSPNMAAIFPVRARELFFTVMNGYDLNWRQAKGDYENRCGV